MIGSRLRKARIEAGLTQVDLAVAMGDRYTSSMISQVESGLRSMRFDGAVNAASELGVSLDYLAGLTDDPTPYSELTMRLGELDALKHELRRPPYVHDATPTAGKDHANPELTDVGQLAEVAAAAGSGVDVYDETVTNWVPFRRDWLRRHRLDPAVCHIITVRGNSMEPTLPAGCSILVDRSRRELRRKHIYVLRTEEGVVVKRVDRSKNGWWLLSDNPSWLAATLTEDTDIIGEVRWAARTF